MTHDLLRDLLEAFERPLQTVTITELREGVFYAELGFEGGITVSARPSDAIALAMRSGAVIRGETSHYDHVCNEAARGIQDVALRTGVPCGFGLVTVENMEQAMARSGGGKRDQGAHAAEAVLALVRVRAELL
ncbi:MAG: 6,7-dimethyl-8-ribityllumazine synthase [Actinobacteria bacterium]|nr:6,7-dimethyl-8-ribityllumazine synthase [Actinomycetota bacterium]